MNDKNFFINPSLDIYSYIKDLGAFTVLEAIYNQIGPEDYSELIEVIAINNDFELLAGIELDSLLEMPFNEQIGLIALLFESLTDKEDGFKTLVKEIIDLLEPDQLDKCIMQLNLLRFKT